MCRSSIVCFAKTTLSSILALTLMSSPGVTLTTTNQNQNTVVEREGGFSYVAPDGWRVESSELSRFRIVLAPIDGTGFTANIIFSVTDYSGDSRSFRNAVLRELRTLYGESISLISENNFQTQTGLNGIRLTFNLTSHGLSLRSVVYLLDLGSHKMSVTYSRLRERQRQYDKDVESLVATIRRLKAQSQTPRHVDNAGGFSYVIPSGWRLSEKSPNSFSSLVKDGTGPTEHATISFKTITDKTRSPIDNMLLKEYSRSIAERLRRQMGDELRQLKLADARLFKTSNGYNGARFTVVGTLDRLPIRIAHYFVEIGTATVMVVYMRIGIVNNENLRELREADQLVDSLIPAKTSYTSDPESST